MFNRVYKFGFRKKHSTNHALIEITENIRKSLDKKYACGIFIDLQKAFDTVNPSLLITNKLNHYGITGVGNSSWSGEGSQPPLEN